MKLLYPSIHELVTEAFNVGAGAIRQLCLALIAVVMVIYGAPCHVYTLHPPTLTKI